LVKWISPTELELPLDPGVFSSAKNEMAEFIESVWKNDKVKLKIRWADKTSLPELFQIQLGQAAGGRASMNYNKKSITMNPGTRSRSLAHEAGHVLGFRDEYFTLWDGSENCTYIVEYTEEDVMSTSSSGKVTDVQWKALETVYARPAATPVK
ncbi:MAG: hypothetical protein ABL958_19270, partial [Bdellovibrionia bacterium]